MLSWKALTFAAVSPMLLLLTGCATNSVGQSVTQATVTPSAAPLSSPPPSGTANYATAQEAGIAGAAAKTRLTYTTGACPAGQSCLSNAQVFGNADPNVGLDAAYVQIAAGGSGGGAVCDAYVYYDSAGWHVFPPVVCVQQSGYNPVLGTQDHVQVPGGGCANVRQQPTTSSKVLTCLKDGTVVTIDTLLPRYADGHIWWSINHQQGFMAHDYLITQQ